MEEQTYNVLGVTGILNIALGAIAIVAGVASGVALIFSGYKLLSSKKNIIF